MARTSYKVSERLIKQWIIKLITVINNTIAI